ncbi:hypothetical protein C8F01DRAFT_1348909 [Mycena amicta]|nr:hypothetical protein C8F01DRAFT_1348909 [Mycena amicta]
MPSERLEWCSCNVAPYRHKVSPQVKRQHEQQALSATAKPAITKGAIGNSTISTSTSSSLDRTISLPDEAFIAGLQDASSGSLLNMAANHPPLGDGGAAAIKKRTRQHTIHTRKQDILSTVSAKVDAALDSIRDAEMDISTNPQSVWETIDDAAKTTSLAVNSLLGLEETSEKNDVLSALQELQKAMDSFRQRLPRDTRPLGYDCSHLKVHPIEKLDVAAQILVLIGVICNLLFGLSIERTNFILDAVTLMVELVMSLHTVENEDGSRSYDIQQRQVLKDLPSSLYTALKQLNLDAKMVVYAACPSCHEIHAPDPTTLRWPTKCHKVVLRKTGAVKCRTELLETRKSGLYPVKPFMAPSFIDYVAALVSNPENERLMDEVCDEAKANLTNEPTFVKDAFQARFFKTFEGPISGQLFIDRGSRMRLAFCLSLDFFKPRGNRLRANGDSIGVMTLSCLNLPVTLRYKPEHPPFSKRLLPILIKSNSFYAAHHSFGAAHLQFDASGPQ